MKTIVKAWVRSEINFSVQYAERNDGALFMRVVTIFRGNAGKWTRIARADIDASAVEVDDVKGWRIPKN